ncbi:MAG TPA: DUF4124 domain-containing protein [Woeseiaceae bacterium]|jgi:hypothetical protein
MKIKANAAQAVLATLLSTTAVLLLAAGIASASDIYKWTDAEGNINYGDRPSGTESEVRLQIASQPTDPARIQAQASARDEQRALAREAEANAPAGPSEEELRAKARERAEKCTTYRARLEKFIQSRRLYREVENGERVYLDETETQAARENVQRQVEEYCSP